MKTPPRRTARSVGSWLFAAALVGGLGACWLVMAWPQPVAATDTTAAAAVPAAPGPGPALDQVAAHAPVQMAESSPFPAEFYRQYPPGTRIEMRIPFVRAGIEVSPGLFLPPLNGVKLEDGIPAIGRNPRLPPPGPVVAKVVGPDGQEYWEHEDGSYTSCTYSRIQKPDGTMQEIVATQHGAVQAARRQAPR
ncbi:MAG: hypothetical protein ACYTGW_11385 [Planctomycetota bacterium]